MKKAFKLQAIRRIAGLVVMLAASIFSMAACDDGSGPGGSGSGGSGGSGSSGNIIGTWDRFNQLTGVLDTGFSAARFEFTANGWTYYYIANDTETLTGTWTTDGRIFYATVLTTSYENITYHPGDQITVSFEGNDTIYCGYGGFGRYRRRR